MPDTQYLSRKRALDRIAQEKLLYERRSGGEVSVCVIYPNLYRLGMANLGYQAIFQIFDSHPSVDAERAFLPDPDERAALRAGSGRLSSFERGRALSDFDILAFSVAFETDYLNVLAVLRMAGIPLTRSERAGRNFPLILAGGSAIFLNPEPVAEFVDLFLIGEGEEMVPEFLARFLATARDPARLAALAEVPGAYLPAYFHPADASGDAGFVRRGSCIVRSVIGRPTSLKPKRGADLESAGLSGWSARKWPACPELPSWRSGLPMRVADCRRLP